MDKQTPTIDPSDAPMSFEQLGEDLRSGKIPRDSHLVITGPMIRREQAERWAREDAARDAERKPKP